jgi:hypothetical protein
MVYAVDKIDSFLKQFPIFPNAFLVGGPADFFVIELADQVYSIISPQGICFDEWVYFLACREYICVFIWSPNSFACQLQKLKVEPVLLHYLSQIKVLQGGIIHLFSKNSV